jgi:hypothetical protein
MGVWWHLRQWVYARPRVAAAGAVALLLLVGFGGWQSARWFASDGAAQAADTAVYGVRAARTVRIEDKNGRIIDHTVARTRTVTLPGQGHTVVVKGVTRVVPTTRIRNGRVIIETRPAIAKTVTDIQAQTVVKTHTVTQLLDRTVTVTRTQIQPAQTEAGTQIPPGHIRTAVTVTVTQTQTVTQAAVTVTVTTSKGH